MRARAAQIWVLTGLLLLGAAGTQAKTPLSLDAIFAGDLAQGPAIAQTCWNEDGAGFSYLSRDPETGLAGIHSQDVDGGDPKPVIAAGQLSYKGRPLHIGWRDCTRNDRFKLLSEGEVRTWDGAAEAVHYIYDIQSRALRPLVGENEPTRYAELSPGGDHVGYVRNNNLYVADLRDLRPQAVTSDGDANIFNGIFDYGSTEFGPWRAWHWSPDGSRIAFWRLDASDVKTFHIVDELGKYNSVNALKYPNTGERHARIKIGVYDLRAGRTTWVDTGDNPDDYIPRITWSGDSRNLIIQRLSRDHKTLDLLLADSRSGASRAIHRETDRAWIDITDDLLALSSRQGFVWTSEESGYRHAYLFDESGEKWQLTEGDWEISSLISVDEARGWLYFYAKKDGFINQHVYRVKLDGSGLEKISGPPGWHEWQVSPDGDLAIARFSDIRTPTTISLMRTDGTHLALLDGGMTEKLAEYALPQPEFLEIETSDGIRLNAMMIRPSHFDERKTYPVIAYGYGNAGSQVVTNRWGNWRGPSRLLWHKYMAQRGYIVFSVDNRTTAGRGKAAKNLTYGHYAKYAVNDQLEAARYLKSLPYVDGERLGFWGWSGGAYLANALMTKGAPHFKVGVSVAPVIDLSRYQSVGVERWMGQLDENPAGYYQTNLINFADRLEGKLLLIHGTADENVKYGFTLQFADALIRADKQFDMMIYPGQHHGLSDVQQHVYTRISAYFDDHL
ncbi:S9 family peptidase [Pacificimonas sp. WHA3]|uniref:S9 family peptidase n=1 Tax=Pacificimonas pallii TaxID=2827236 RepID=A0ABS6SGE1_9SPHN|nr:DPP IV N-terminal domain-containing protein [Pacificimonas pallii]MBV7257484.1 S9 family peptidase [Pacificimonas pallii]